MVRNVIDQKVNALLRYCLGHGFTKLFPLYVVNEYPKSGGSWVGELLSDALGVPFPRNRYPVFRSSILHGHMMQSWNVHNMVLVWRDGRDVLVSQYYHWLFKNDKGNANLVDKSRAELGFNNYDDITTNLPEFIDYIFSKSKHPRFSWAEFAKKWADQKQYSHVHYEDLLKNPVDELSRLLFELTGDVLDGEKAKLIIETHSFEKVTGRKAGITNKTSFLRKGIAGDWRNKFNGEAKLLFNHYAGEALVNLGYESDDSWSRQ